MAARTFDWGKGLLEVWAINEEVNQHLLRHLDARAWRAEVPGYKGKTIATTFSHMHNSRLMWLTMSDKSIVRPAKTDRSKVTIAQAKAALAKSAKAFAKLLEKGTTHAEGRVRQMPPNVIGAMGYIMTHEAHHRGQVMLMARQVGCPVELMVMAGMWQWGKMWKKVTSGK